MMTRLSYAVLILLLLIGLPVRGSYVLVLSGEPSVDPIPEDPPFPPDPGEADWYLDFTYTGADDDGTTAKPWSTYELVAAHAEEGDYVELRTGATVEGSFKYDSSVDTWKSGISCLPLGIRGTDWDEEVNWYIPAQDDRKTIYLRSTTEIALFHNARNCRSAGSRSVVYDIGVTGGGDIRYCIDRNRQMRYQWGLKAGTDRRYAAYTAPFSLDSRTYGSGYSDDSSTVAVVGSTGDNGESIDDRVAYYCYGQVDDFGDEWHELAWADDDTAMQIALGQTTKETYSSDGKSLTLVVAPNTPCLRWAATGVGQFYTTPAKMWYIPKVHAQTTYISPTGITFALSNVMTAAPCYYKWDSAESYTEYTGPVDCSGLSDGSHTLRYYYRNDVVKTRTVVMDPCFPSIGETHGYALWEDDTKFNAIKALCLTDSARHIYEYGLLVNATDDQLFESRTGLGKRYFWRDDDALNNAFVAKVKGYTNDTGTATDGESCIKRAKGMLLDNSLGIDDMWLNCGNSCPNPCVEQRYRGYYDIYITLGNLFAYDLLIHDYNSTDDALGITPIEDYKIRDSLAKYACEGMMTCGLYENFAWENPDIRDMWGTSRELATYMIGIVMTGYDSVAYGTSGFDGTAATHAYTPFPDQTLSWKDVLYTEGVSMPGWPNMYRVWGIHTLILETPTVRPQDALELAVGCWADRTAYALSTMEGGNLQLFSNVLKVSPITTAKSYPYLDAFYAHCNAGTLYGMTISKSSDLLPVYRPQVMLINENFPDLAEDADTYLTGQGEGEYGYEYQMYTLGVYSLLFYNPVVLE